MLRFFSGLFSALALALAALPLLGPPEGLRAAPGFDRLTARAVMAAHATAALTDDRSRLSRVLDLHPRRPSDLCAGITGQATAILAARLSGQADHATMTADALNDPVLRWLVDLSWALVPDGATASDTAPQFASVASTDCARAFI